MKEYIGAEVNIDGEEGEVIEKIGFHFYRIDFFDLNKGSILIDLKEIDKYLKTKSL